MKKGERRKPEESLTQLITRAATAAEVDVSIALYSRPTTVCLPDCLSLSLSETRH